MKLTSNIWHSLSSVVSARVLGLLIAVLTITNTAQAQNSTESLTPAEIFVLASLSLGREADLNEWFPGKSDQRLRSSFIEKLLVGEVQLKDARIDRHGVRIVGAVFDEPIDLVAATVGHEVFLTKCEFKGPVLLMNSHFTGDLSFLGSRFDSPVQALDPRVQSIELEKILSNPNFETMRVDGNLSLRHSTIFGSANFSHVQIGGQLDLSETRFEGKNRLVTFNSLRVGTLVALEGAVFEGPADFITAEVPGSFLADRARFEDDLHLSQFDGLRVGRLASFQCAVFKGGASFRGIQISRDFLAPGAQFAGETLQVDFSMMKAGGLVSFGKSFLCGRNATFAGPVTFQSAQIGGRLEVAGVAFTNKESTASFESIQVGQLASFVKTKFAGPVNFSGADFRDQFIADEASFESTKHSAYFDRFKAEGIVSLKRAVFAGPVNFSHAKLGDLLTLEEAKFTQSGATSSFDDIEIAGVISLKNAVFKGPANFLRARIGTGFYAENTKFDFVNHATTRDRLAHAVDFTALQVKGESSFRNVKIAGDVSFDDAELFDLLFFGTSSSPASATDLSLSRAVIYRELQVKNAEVERLTARSLKVLGPTSLDGLSVRSQLDFRDAQFSTLEYLAVSIPLDPKQVRLGGMAYQDISAGDPPEAWRKLLKLLGGAKFTNDGYSRLESYFKNHGYSDRADLVFLSMKRREREEVLSSRPFESAWSWILDELVDYGRSPQKVLRYILPFILFGTLLFLKRSGMDPNAIEDADKFYNCFWFSLDLFVPAVDLKMAATWTPKRSRWFARHWVMIHRLAGWILVPISLLAIFGFFK